MCYASATRCPVLTEATLVPGPGGEGGGEDCGSASREDNREASTELASHGAYCLRACYAKSSTDIWLCCYQYIRNGRSRSPLRSTGSVFYRPMRSLRDAREVLKEVPREILVDRQVANPASGLRAQYAMPGTEGGACLYQVETVKEGTGLRACYAKPGTDLAIGGTSSCKSASRKYQVRMPLRAGYAMSGTDLRYGASSREDRASRKGGELL
eukprot:2643174-Rhodomonas_salina.1